MRYGVYIFAIVLFSCFGCAEVAAPIEEASDETANAIDAEPVNKKYRDVAIYFVRVNDYSKQVVMITDLPLRTQQLKDQDWGEAGKLTIEAYPRELRKRPPTPWSSNGPLCFPFRIVNRTEFTAHFSTFDSHLYIELEAKDSDNRWKPIETEIRRMGCAFSFYSEPLEANHYWEFLAPVYTGTMPTTLRFSLEAPQGKIYSSEFPGTINPTQFIDEPIEERRVRSRELERPSATPPTNRRR